MSDRDGTQPLAAPAPDALPGAPKPAARRLSLDVLLGSMQDGGAAAAAVVPQGLGAPDLTGLLESTLQHMQSMQSLPRESGALRAVVVAGQEVEKPPGTPAPLPHPLTLPPCPPPSLPPCAGLGSGGAPDLDALFSPKWRALLSFEGDVGGGGPAAMDTAGSGTSSAPSSTILALGRDVEGAPISPGVDQEMGAAALREAWRNVGQAPRTAGVAPQVEKEPAEALPPRRPRGFGGKKRPAPEQAPQCDGDAEDAEEMPPPAKQACKAEAPLPSAFVPFTGGGGGIQRLATFTSGDAAMLDSEACFAELATAGTAGEDLSPTDVLTGLDRVRLDSIGSPRAARRLTTAAAAAAVTPAGRHGKLHRGDSGVAMLSPGLPVSPTGAQLLPPALGLEGDATVVAAVHVQARGKLAAVSAVKQEAPASTAATPASGLAGQLTESERPHVPTKSHKAVPTGALGRACISPALEGCAAACIGVRPTLLPDTAHLALPRPCLCLSIHPPRPAGEGGVFTSLYRGVTRHKLTGRYEAHFWDSSYVRPNVVRVAAVPGCASACGKGAGGPGTHRNRELSGHPCPLKHPTPAAARCLGCRRRRAGAARAARSTW